MDIEDDVEALTCGSETVTRYKNGTLIDTQYFANETLSVLQIGNEISACYLHRSVPLPDGIDFVQASETDVRQEANAETSAAIVALVPQCAGRVVYELVPETDATTTGTWIVLVISITGLSRPDPVIYRQPPLGWSELRF
ncbi:uncharacterized protein LOC124266500 [Haliotis rubra]|uniref:uncharacterized protein LOC124266500 n=1 Tax=Haliotis rubra TaxID=36100 RepID=UPI001EE5135A|nr:uncharacterized protein LOC124266500 [Haliotis rubra]